MTNRKFDDNETILITMRAALRTASGFLAAPGQLLGAPVTTSPEADTGRATPRRSLSSSWAALLAGLTLVGGCLGALSAGAAESVDYDRLAKAYAGLGQEGEATYRKAVDISWSAYQRRHGQPMTAWAQKEIAYPGGGTIFYPFSGPDFVTVAQLYPNADHYVLVAIQGAQQPANLSTMAPKRLAAFRAKFTREWEKFGLLGFFRTNDLDEDLKDKNGQIGVSTILMTFAARLGYTVTDVYPIALNATTGELEKADPAARWNSVRLILKKDGKDATVDYVRMDLSDYGLKNVAGTREFIDRQAHNPVLIKAASHLLQQGNFSTVRESLVANAPLVLQDETGLDYRDLSRIGEVTLYGRFVKPHPLFNQKDQLSLAQAYKTTKAKELGFSFSYQKTAENRSLQVVRRKVGGVAATGKAGA